MSTYGNLMDVTLKVTNPMLGRKAKTSTSKLFANRPAFQKRYAYLTLSIKEFPTALSEYEAHLKIEMINGWLIRRNVLFIDIKLKMEREMAEES